MRLGKVNVVQEKSIHVSFLLIALNQVQRMCFIEQLSKNLQVFLEVLFSEAKDFRLWRVEFSCSPCIWIES